jgi:hypothetical protein
MKLNSVKISQPRFDEKNHQIIISAVRNQQRLQGFFGVRLYTISTYAPLVFGGAHLRANSWLSIGLNASYGGFARFRTGFYAQSSFKSMTIALASEDVIGLVSNQGKGKSVVLRLRYSI